MIVPILPKFQPVGIIRVTETGVVSRDFIIQGIFNLAVTGDNIIVPTMRPAALIDMIIKKGVGVANRRTGRPVGSSRMMHHNA